MRFMVLFEADRIGEAMARYRERMARAGVLLAAGELQPTAAGASISFAGGKRVVVEAGSRPRDAAGTRRVAGYWLIQVGSTKEAIAWASRCPGGDGCELQVRRVFDPPAALDPAIAEAEADLRRYLWGS